MQQEVTIPIENKGERIDLFLSDLFSQYSRAKIQKELKQGQILVNGVVVKAKYKILGGEQVVISIDDEEIELEAMPQQIKLDKVYEDDDILVINKPVGLVVHPGAGNMQDTLLNGLLYDLPQLKCVPRAGIVHRLDKDTTGLMVVAKNIESHLYLIEQIQLRKVSREYQAIVCGVPVCGETIDTAFGRHHKNRLLMSVLRDDHQQAKRAVTHFQVVKKYAYHSLLKVKLETGRTHQIRVHLAHRHLPIVGDQSYAGRVFYPPQCAEELRSFLEKFMRQALHAWQLGLFHPRSKQWLQWQVEAPEDMLQLQSLLEQHSATMN